MVYTGVDACKIGWFAVTLGEGHDRQVAIFPDIFSLWKQCKGSKLILIDIPIGLRQGSPGKRTCDEEARRLLSVKRGASVFAVPCREVIYADMEEASQLSERMTGKKLSKQSLNIISKIRQVDQLLLSDKNARLRIRETHPELCFWALNGGEPMKFLLSAYPYTKGLVYYAKRNYPGRELARDDILDALAAAFTASKEIEGLSFLPEKLTFDAKGLPMQMAYYFMS